MRKIEIELMDREYAMLTVDAVLDGQKPEDIGKIITAIIREKYRNRASPSFDKRISSSQEFIERLKKAQSIVKELGLEKFLKAEPHGEFESG